MRRLAIAALAGALLLAACGGDDGGSSGPPSASQSPYGASKPTVTVPDGAPPKTLQVRDIEVGTGTAVKSGDQLAMHYVGVSWSTKKQFDASWDSGKPFTFRLGAGMVIPGWDQGIAGMKLGGRRELIIPPDLGYGASGSGPIGPNETLVFVVDLVQINPS